MIGLLHSQNVPGVFHKSMLEAAAGTQKWYVSFASKPDSVERTNGIFVWTSWYAPDAVIRRKLICGALDL
jgi:hypothetical protein